MSAHGSRNTSVVSSSGQRQATKDEESLGLLEQHSEGGVDLRSLLCGTRTRRVTCWCSTLAVFLLLLGVITPIVMNEIITMGVEDAVVIDSTSASSYDVWQSNYYGSGDKTDVHYDVYLFDLQNMNEALNGSKPVVVEKGPYAFKKYFNKFDISWSDDGDTVTYQSQTFFMFNEDRTGPGLSLDDEITLPYPVVLGFNYLLENLPVETEAFLDATVESMINAKLMAAEADIDDQIAAIEASDEYTQEEKDAMIAELNQAKGLIEQVRLGMIQYIETNAVGTSVLKLLLCLGNPDGISPFFKANPVDAYFGYLNDPILVLVDQLLLKMGKPNDTWSTAVPGITTNYTTEIDTARRNNPIVQKTGKKSLSKVGRLVTYNGMSQQWVCLSSSDSQDPNDYVKGEEYPACELYQESWNASTASSKGYIQAFATDYANRIAGSDGQLYGVPTTDDKIELYIPDIYRTLYVEHVGDREDWYSVKLRRYGIQMKDLHNYDENPEEAWQYFNYAPTGMENLTRALGVPTFVSKPHFLDGAESLQTDVMGMNARREMHDTFLDIEPNTGLLARVHKRLQVNYQMRNVNLPEVTPEAVAAANMLCESKGVPCDGLNIAMQCLATPSNWVMHNDKVYMPYSWADEHAEGTEDDADGIKDGIYWAQDFGAAVRFWSFVCVGLVLVMLIGIHAGEHLAFSKLANGDEDMEDVSNHYNLLG